MNQLHPLLDAVPVVRPSSESERSARRHAVDLAATIRLLDPRSRAQVCRLRQLSLGSGFVELRRLSMGTRVQLNFGLPGIDDRLSLEGRVQWATDSGVGVQFDGLRPQEVWVLWQYLESPQHESSRASRAEALAVELRQRAATVDGRSGRRLREEYERAMSTIG